MCDHRFQIYQPSRKELMNTRTLKKFLIVQFTSMLSFSKLPQSEAKNIKVTMGASIYIYYLKIIFCAHLNSAMCKKFKLLFELDLLVVHN